MEARPIKLCVDRKAAAEMVDLSPGAFDAAVRKGLLPYPIEMGRRKVWSVKALEKAIDRLAGMNNESEPEQNEWMSRLGEGRSEIRPGGRR
jgi:hypothetical protein